MTTAKPAVVFHNRLEGTPRADDFERAQRCEVRDAAFMLALAYANGEYLADDAGSLALAKLRIETSPIDGYRVRDEVAKALGDVPLEAHVERRPIPRRLSGVDVSMDIRLLMGRQWLKMIGHIGNFGSQFAEAFPIVVAATPEESDPSVGAHPEAWCALAVVAGRRMDGMKLYEHLRASPRNHACDAISSLALHQEAIKALEQPFIDWFQRLIAEPQADQDAWDSSRLEYQFSCSSPGLAPTQELAAKEYFQGRLDWYSVDIANSGREVPADRQQKHSPHVTSVATLPAPVIFDGMPNPRLWSFEDRRINFGEISPATTDLTQLLWVEFGAKYSNDWHLIPCNLPPGVSNVKGLVVTTVFGERFWIDGAGTRAADSWQSWAMYDVESPVKADANTASMLVLLPTPAKIQEGEAREEILVARDEILNSVWGLEERVLLPSGDSKPGGEAAREILAFHKAANDRRLAAIPAITATAAVGEAPESAPKFRYELMNSIAENWIPFVPVRVSNSDSQIQLQRAALLRTIDGESRPAKIQPRTSILRVGLDVSQARPYFIHEEEVPRSGIRVTASFQRTRWTDGGVWIWLGMRKRCGRGERSSGLAFDQLVPAPPD